MAPTPEASERITKLFFTVYGELIRGLQAENDRDGLEALPPVVLTTGVIALCQSLSIETVMEILDGLKVRVESGDFSRIHLPFCPPPPDQAN